MTPDKNLHPSLKTHRGSVVYNQCPCHWTPRSPRTPVPSFLRVRTTGQKVYLVCQAPSLPPPVRERGRKPRKLSRQTRSGDRGRRTLRGGSGPGTSPKTGLSRRRASAPRIPVYSSLEGVLCQPLSDRQKSVRLRYLGCTGRVTDDTEESSSCSSEMYRDKCSATHPEGSLWPDSRSGWYCSRTWHSRLLETKGQSAKGSLTAFFRRLFPTTGPRPPKKNGP